jgi:hypothetical protein
MSLLSVKADSTLVSTEHIAGKLNVLCDQLSRNVRLDSNLISVALEIVGREKEEILQFINLCDPTVNTIHELPQHVSLLQNFLDLLL